MKDPRKFIKVQSANDDNINHVINVGEIESISHTETEGELIIIMKSGRSFNVREKLNELYHIIEPTLL